MYGEKTIGRYLQAMVKWVHFYEAHIDTVHVSISDGNDKIGHVANVSTAAVLTCPHCEQCKHWCYDIRDCFRRGYDSSTMRSRAKNTAIMLKDPGRYHGEIRDFLRTYTGAFFRWHVGGETSSAAYRDEMIKTAVMFPDILFFTYSKEYALWNAVPVLPDNLIVMYSEWRGLKMENPHNRPVFRVRFKDKPVPEGCTWECPGNCDVCKSCRRGCIVGESTWVNAH